MQVVEVHDVVVDVLRTDHQVTNQLGVTRHFGADGIFDRAHGRNAVYEGADAADALRERPRVTRVAVPQDDLYASHHGAGRVRLRDLVAVHLCFDSQVAFDTSDRIDNDSCVHASSSRFSATISMRLPIL